MSRKPARDNLNKGFDVASSLKNISIPALEDEIHQPAERSLEKEQGSSPENKSTELPATRQTSLNVEEAPDGGARRPKTPPPETNNPKIKVNLYLGAATKRLTEKIQMQLRDMAPPESAGQINYSLIIDTALQIAFADFERQKSDSPLSKRIISQLRKGIKN